MANNGNIITYPVSVSDVNKVLGRSHTDVGHCCTETRVNKWAKYKPLRLSVINTVDGQWDATNNTWLTSATWWKGQARTGARRPHYTCGMVLNAYDDDRASFKSAIDNGNGGWDWDAPVGDNASPYRITDFAEYVHTAPALFESFDCPSEVSVNGQFSMVMRYNDINNSRFLRLNDIFPNSASNRVWFFGVICYNGTEKLGECNSKVPIGLPNEMDSNDSSVVHAWYEIKLKAPSGTGTYTLYPCIFYASNYDNNPTGSITSDRTPVTQTFVALPLPLFAPKTVNVTSSGGGGGGGGTTSQQLSYYAVFYLVYTDLAQTSIDLDNSWLEISCTTTAGSAVGTTTRTNTAKMYLGSTLYSGFTQQSDTFTYSGSSNNPHTHIDTLTYTAFGTGSTTIKKQNMYEAIQQAQNGNAYIQINDGNRVLISTRFAGSPSV